MKTSQQALAIVATTVCMVLAITLYLSFTLRTQPQAQPAYGDSVYSSTQFSIATTSANFTVTTSATILGTTTTGKTRAFTSVCNESGTNAVILDLNQGNPVVNGNGIYVATGTCFTINTLNLYSGAITASTTNGGSATVSVQSYEL